MAKRVLIVYHSMGGNTAAAAKAVAEGVKSVKGVEAVLVKAKDANGKDLLVCDAYCFGTPDYFGYMAGMLKDFFDRAHGSTEGKLADRPCGVFVSHGGGGAAAESMEEMCRSFKLKRVGKTVLFKEKPDENAKENLRRLGVVVGRSTLQ